MGPSMLGLHRFWGEGQLYYYFSNNNPSPNYYSTNSPRASIIIQIIISAVDYHSHNNPEPLLLFFDNFSWNDNPQLRLLFGK